MGMFKNWMGQNDDRPAGNSNNNSGGNNPQNNGNNNNNNTNNNNNNNTDNKNDSIDDLVQNIWSDVKDGNSGGGNQPQNQQQPQNQNNPNNNNNNGPQKTPEEQIADHLKSVGLEPIQLTEQDKTALQSGDFGGVMDRINQKITGAYIESMKASNKLIENAVTKAVDQAVNKSKNFVEGTQLRELLNEKLPFTKDASIGPVAETIMQRLLGKGATKDQALDGVQKWFDRTFKTVNPDFQPNPNRNEGFRRTPQSTSEDTDWLKALQGN